MFVFMVMFVSVGVSMFMFVVMFMVVCVMFVMVGVCVDFQQFLCCFECVDVDDFVQIDFGIVGGDDVGCGV